MSPLTLIGLLMLGLSCYAAYIYVTKVSLHAPKKSLKARNEQAALKALEFKKTKANQLTIENVTVGGVLHFSNIGLMMEEFDAEVTSRHSYQSGPDRWFELELDRGHNKVYLTVEKDDEFILSLTMQRLTFEQIGLNRNELSKLDPDSSEPVEYDGENYFLGSIGRASFHKNSNELEGESFHYWEFVTDDGSKNITIERWGDGSCDISFSIMINLNQITIYSTTAEKFTP